MFSRDEYQHTASLLRSDNDRIVKATLSNNYNIILAALDAATNCCHSAADPAPWKAGVDDASDPSMVGAMHRIRCGLSHRTPLPDFIWMLKAAVQIDSRTTMGHDIQRCLLSNAADRLEILYVSSNTLPAGDKNLERVRWGMSWRYYNGKIRDAWAVFRRRAVALYV